MASNTDFVVRLADKLKKRYDTTDPYALCEARGITIIPRPFTKQKGAYKVILKNPFIFLKDDMDPALTRIVLYHELGHDALHRRQAASCGGFQEFNLFDMRESRMEYEANLFASELSLPDEEILRYIEEGYDQKQIAMLMNSDENLVALKTDILISRGHDLYRKEHENCFLKN